MFWKFVTIILVLISSIILIYYLTFFKMVYKDEFEQPFPKGGGGNEFRQDILTEEVFFII